MRDAGDIWLSLRYRPPVTVSDTSCTLSGNLSMYYKISVQAGDNLSQASLIFIWFSLVTNGTKVLKFLKLKSLKGGIFSYPSYRFGSLFDNFCVFSCFVLETVRDLVFEENDNFRRVGNNFSRTIPLSQRESHHLMPGLKRSSISDQISGLVEGLQPAARDSYQYKAVLLYKHWHAT